MMSPLSILERKRERADAFPRAPHLRGNATGYFATRAAKCGAAVAGWWRISALCKIYIDTRAQKLIRFES